MSPSSKDRSVKSAPLGGKKNAASVKPVAATPQAPAPTAKPLLMHVISGTHWDREWRYTYEQSKVRLSNLVDKLISILEATPDFKCFHFDGGMVAVDDYLSVRPENEERLRALCRAGRILFTPWYTLPDMFLVGPEAIIRNLQFGKRMAEPYGGGMKSGYTATSYGQTSQLPQIYRGFGIETALFYRGTNKHQSGPVFLWEGKDGSKIHVIRGFDEVTRTNWFFYVHQPLVFGKKPRDLGYTYQASETPVHMADEGLYESDFQALKETTDFDSSRPSLERALRHIRRQALPYAIGRHILALDMEDNGKPFPKLPQMIQALNDVDPDIHIVSASFDEYVEAAIEEIRSKRLPINYLQGEIRQTSVEPGFNGLYGMVTSSRTHLKTANEKAETWLIHQAEPMSSLAAMATGWEYPRTNLDRAWMNLLQNQAHDSICGAAVDQVHRDMMTRFSQTIDVAQEVTRRACEAVWSGIDLSGFQPGDQTLTFFNMLPQRRKGVFAAVVDLPRPAASAGYVDPCSGLSAVEDVDEKKAGPGGKAAAGRAPAAPASPTYSHFDIVDAKGQVVASQLLSREGTTVRIEREYDSAIGFEADRCRLLIEAEVPAMGYRTYALRPRGPKYVEDPKPGGERGLIATRDGVLENEFLRVRLNSNGTFSMTHKPSGTLFEDLHSFADSGSVGNAHLDRRPIRDFHVTSLGAKATLTLVESSALRGVWRIDLVLPVPAAATLDGKERLRETLAMTVTSWLTLRAGSRRLDIRTRVDNPARDHRLEAMFPTDIATDHVAAESAFAVEDRSVLWTVTGDNSEKYYPHQPMQNFVDVSDGRVGLALLNKGMREYSMQDDRRRTLGLTLFRTHRAYMTANSNMTYDELDNYTGPHCLGKQEFTYALYPHGGDWRKGEVAAEAYDHKVSVLIIQGVPKPGPLPRCQSIVDIQPAGTVLLAALTQSDDGKAYLLRLWNSREEPVAATIQTTLPVRKVVKVRLDEKATATEYKVQKGGKIAVPMGKAEIVTLRLEMAKD